MTALLVLVFLSEWGWVRHGGGALHADAVVLERDGEHVTVLCRARLADGNLHPGTSRGNSCAIPQKGRVERPAEFEVAVGGTAQWTADDWAAAAIVGRQGRTDLYFCRAQVRIGSAAAGWVFGKAYREGPHAGHCYVGYGDREMDVTSGFEILHIEAPRSKYN